MQVSDKVRVVTEGSPFKQDDVRVEQLVDGKWVLYRSYNSLSNDYAYTEAKQAADALAKQLASTPKP